MSNTVAVGRQVWGECRMRRVKTKRLARARAARAPLLRAAQLLRLQVWACWDACVSCCDLQVCRCCDRPEM